MIYFVLERFGPPGPSALQIREYRIDDISKSSFFCKEDPVLGEYTIRLRTQFAKRAEFTSSRCTAGEGKEHKGTYMSGACTFILLFS